jgi:hypothetical protein
MNPKQINSHIRKSSNLKDILVRLGWLAVVIPSIVYSLTTTIQSTPMYTLDISKWIYSYINLGSFVVGVIAAIIIFWRKPRDWLAIIVSLMLVTWTSTSNGYDFWVTTSIGGRDWNALIAYFISIPYTLLLSLLLLGVLLAFPDGKWTPNWTRWLFTLSVMAAVLLPLYLCVILIIGVVGTMLENFLGSDDFILIFGEIVPELFRLGALMLGAVMQIYRLITTRDAFQRQQIKWIALSLVGMTLFYVLYNLAALFTEWQAESTPMLTLFLLTLLFTYGFIITFAISVLRYRIWDIDIVINKTLVYSALTAILGSLGIAGTVLFDYYAKLYLNESSSVVGLFVILPLIILFAPLRDSLQNFVDRHFKPEEIDFSGSIVEFSPEAQLMLSSSDILKILTQQVREQLNLSDAEIYLKHENGNMILSEPLQDESAVPVLIIPERERSMLESRDVVVPVDLSRYSLYIPLSLKRASKPEFLGVLALGMRENGIGYSSSVIKSLRNFGVEAGKVLYIAKLRESTGKNIIERLASIEKGLANLKPDVS